jgi:hypothetical protein
MPIDDSELVLAWKDQEGSTEPGLRLRFRRAEPETGSCHPDGLIAGELSLVTMAASWTSRFLCFGSDLLKFADQLEHLQRTFDGRAEFTNSEGSLSITISPADRSRGRLAVGGEIEIPALIDFRGEESPVGVLPHPGVALRFDGLVWEQSYVPAVVQAIGAFLRENAISTTSPWLSSKPDRPHQNRTG